jgi:putative hydrolase of HD superfamily
MRSTRFEKQLAFLKEIDRLKGIVRRTRLLDDSRCENDAEHSWHLAVMALTLAEYANVRRLNIARVIAMVLIHDIVEIDAGDTYLYDSALREEKKEKESRAATRIFGLLPGNQSRRFRSLWREFEARKTPEARFAWALDRLEPVIQNIATRGRVWRKHGITRKQAEEVNRPIAEGSEFIWAIVKKSFAEADAQKFFARERRPRRKKSRSIG